jgi:hypothetical protein
VYYNFFKAVKLTVCIFFGLRAYSPVVAQDVEAIDSLLMALDVEEDEKKQMNLNTELGWHYLNFNELKAWHFKDWIGCRSQLMY